jgi:Cu/Ag efflux protein CusF
MEAGRDGRVLPIRWRERRSRNEHTNKERKMLKKLFARLAVVVLILTASSWAFGAEAKDSGSKTSVEKPKFTEGRLVKLHATIESIDTANRTVTLRGPLGNTLTLPVMNPKNLKGVKVGDKVLVKYREAVAYEVKKADEVAPGSKVEESRSTSKPGETPGGEASSTTTVVATVKSIDLKNNTVTLLGPEGDTETYTARRPEELKKVSVGDRVVIRYTEALAVSLVKNKK